jgi:hypothetical protein
VLDSDIYKHCVGYEYQNKLYDKYKIMFLFKILELFGLPLLDGKIVENRTVD